MTRATCQEVNRSSPSWAPCTFRARWWVAVPYASDPWRRMCGHHARTYVHRWPILSADPERDYLATRPQVET